MTTPQGGYGVIPRWLLRREDVSSHAKLTYAALQSHIDDDDTCWPSHKLLALETSLSVTTVKRALVELRDLGVVTWKERRDESNLSQTSNLYELRVNAPRRLPPTP